MTTVWLFIIHMNNLSHHLPGQRKPHLSQLSTNLLMTPRKTSNGIKRIMMFLRKINNGTISVEPQLLLLVPTGVTMFLTQRIHLKLQKTLISSSRNKNLSTWYLMTVFKLIPESFWSVCMSVTTMLKQYMKSCWHMPRHLPKPPLIPTNCCLTLPPLN